MKRSVKSIWTVTGSGIIVLFLILAYCLPVQAISNSERQTILERKVAETSTELQESLAALQAKPAEGWATVEIQLYLYKALWAVDYGVLLYHCEHGCLPDSLEMLSGTKYVPCWPVNPFNSFQPMEILTVGDGFRPGELVYQVCPPEYYSRIQHPIPLSFDLGIYGPNVSFEEHGDANVMPGNDEWAVVPEGTVYMAGMVTESGKHLKEKWEKIQQEGGSNETEQ